MTWFTRWTQPMEQDLAELWGKGLSARYIGARLGVSHNAVTAKRRRLGLPERPSPIPRRAG